MKKSQRPSPLEERFNEKRIKESSGKGVNEINLTLRILQWFRDIFKVHSYDRNYKETLPTQQDSIRQRIHSRGSQTKPLS